MNEKSLALYMGYAFSHGVNAQHLLAANELSVPYVIYWDNETPTPVPYAAQTQDEAVANARAARGRVLDGTGWSSGREGSVAQNDGTKRDVLLIEGWVRGLDVPLELFVYYRKNPFRLIHGFLWKEHPQARKDAPAFMAEFKRGILMQPFGERCMDAIQNAEPVQVMAQAPSAGDPRAG